MKRASIIRAGQPLKILALFKAALRSAVLGRKNTERTVRITPVIVRDLPGPTLILMRTSLALLVIKRDIILATENAPSIINRLNSTLKG
jgi:hypothetical protein